MPPSRVTLIIADFQRRNGKVVSTMTSLIPNGWHILYSRLFTFKVFCHIDEAIQGEPYGNTVARIVARRRVFIVQVNLIRSIISPSQ